MALELSCLDMELLLSFSTPVESSKYAPTSTEAATNTNNSVLTQATPMQVPNSTQATPIQVPDSTQESNNQQTVQKPNESVSMHAATTTVDRSVIVDNSRELSSISNVQNESSLNTTVSPESLPENSKIIHCELTDKNAEKYSSSYKAEVVYTRDDFSKKKDNYKVKGSVTIYKCVQCPYQNPKIQSMKEHLVNHRQYTNSIKCRYCVYFAPYGLSLQQHEVLHNEYTPSERGFKSEKEKKKFCPECPYKAVKNREIKCHQLNHVYRERYLKCRYCNYYLINTKGMKQHEVLHAIDKSYTVNVIGQSPRQQRKQGLPDTSSQETKNQHQPQQQIPQQQLQTQQNIQHHQLQAHQQTNQQQFQQPQQLQLQPSQVLHTPIHSVQVQPSQFQQVQSQQHIFNRQHQQQVSQNYSQQNNQYQNTQMSSTPVFQQFVTAQPNVQPQGHGIPQQMLIVSGSDMYQPIQTTNLTQFVPVIQNSLQPQLQQSQQIQNNSIIIHSAPTANIVNLNQANEGTVAKRLSGQGLSKNEVSILNNSLKEKETTEKLETLNIADKTGQEFSITYIVKKIQTPSNKYREKGSSTIYCCQLCPYTTKFSTHLREHLPHHRIYPKTIKCRYCVYYASNTLNLKQHEVLHPHYEVMIPKKNLTKKEREAPQAFKNQRKRKRYKCKICPFDGQHPYLIQRHMKNHVFKDGFVKCTGCDYYLATSNNMKQHEVLHQVHELTEAKIQTELKKKKHLCNLCPFKTIQKSHLERHQTFHNKDNFDPKKGYYTCEYCKYYSSNTGKMKQHEVLHTQEWEETIDEVATAEVNTDDETEKSENNDEIFDKIVETDMTEKDKESENKIDDEKNENSNEKDENNTEINDNDIEIDKSWKNPEDAPNKNLVENNKNDNSEDIIKMEEQPSTQTQSQDFIF